MKQKTFSLFLGLIIASYFLQAQDQTVIYKTIDSISLKMEVYQPPNINQSKVNPGMVFFFGGGWKGGSTNQFKPHAEYLSSLGIVCFLADYRVESRQGTTPFESLKDAKSAIRFIKAHAADFMIDSAKLVLSGGSAGGHLAAAAATVTDYNEATDDLHISCKPVAQVLFNPVIDNGPGGYGYERVGEAYKNFSPLHNIHAGIAPTLFFLGTEDALIPVATAEYYKTIIEKVGGRCDLIVYQGQGHGFFNYGKEPYYELTVASTVDFLQSLHLIEKK